MPFIDRRIPCNSARHGLRAGPDGPNSRYWLVKKVGGGVLARHRHRKSALQGIGREEARRSAVRLGARTGYVVSNAPRNQEVYSPQL
jgi:hypothetical protein